MSSTLAKFQDRGSYLFRISHAHTTVSSDQINRHYDPRVEIDLEFQRKPQMWPEQFWPIEARIVCRTLTDFDAITDNQIVLGIIRRPSTDKRMPCLILSADWHFGPSLLAALNQKDSPVYLKVETVTKAEEWNAEDRIAVLSYRLSFESDCRA